MDLLRGLASSIGKKIMVAAAGLLLCGFLVTHLAGNFLLLAGEGTFNKYALSLEENPFIIPAEIGLVALFLIHIVVSLLVTAQNKRARPVAYAEKRTKGGSTLGSMTKVYTGLLVLAFLIIHIKTFKFGDKPDGLFQLVMSSFKKPFYSLFYVIAMAGLGLHLSHGVQSAFKTFGMDHPKYTPLIKGAGWSFALLIAGGFALLPIWAYCR